MPAINTTFNVWGPLVTQARAALLNHLVVWSPMVEDFADLNPRAKLFTISESEVEHTGNIAHQAIEAGRFIDFGHLPNAVIKQGGKRGGPLWQRGAIHSPFHEPWVFMHTWDGARGSNATAVYLVNPSSPSAIEVCEFQPVMLGEMGGAFMIGDRVLFDRVEAASGKSMYHAVASPNIVRFFDDPTVKNQLNNSRSPESAAAGNVGDPTMTAILILATRNVERMTISADEKLQRARIKRGQPPIPNYDVVNSAPYVTALLARNERRERSESLGGSHRSPIPHIRMGHPREYAASGKTIFIADTLVNVTPEIRQGFKGQRSHYRIREAGKAG
jgi:hypothetical protein